MGLQTFPTVLPRASCRCQTIAPPFEEQGGADSHLVRRAWTNFHDLWSKGCAAADWLEDGYYM